jgi:hypothetical protein
MRITEELMQPALLCQTTAIVVCVLGAGMLYSLSTGYFRGATKEGLAQWANAFDVPMKALMALFCVVSPPPSATCSSSRLSPPTNTPHLCQRKALAAFMRVTYRVVAIRYPYCDSEYNQGMCGRLSFRYNTWGLAYAMLLACWLIHVRVTAQMKGVRTGPGIQWFAVWVTLAVVLFGWHYLNETKFHVVDNMLLLLMGSNAAEREEWGCCHSNCLRGNSTEF